MKKQFSKKWIGSRQPRKQRKFRLNAPLHIKRKLMSANLNKELRKKYNRRSFPLKTWDKVKIMRGEFKGRIGKITAMNTMKLKAVVEGIQIAKKDGSKTNIWMQPSNMQIQELNLEDKKRIESINKNKEKKEITQEMEKSKITFKKLPKQEKEKNASKTN